MTLVNVLRFGNTFSGSMKFTCGIPFSYVLYTYNHRQWELHIDVYCVIYLLTCLQIHDKFLIVKINTEKHWRNVIFQGVWIDCLTFYLHHFEFIVRRPSVFDHVVITSVQYDLVDESAQLLQSHLTTGPPSAENEKSTNKWAQYISTVQILVYLYNFGWIIRWKVDICFFVSVPPARCTTSTSFNYYKIAIIYTKKWLQNRSLKDNVLVMVKENLNSSIQYHRIYFQLNRHLLWDQSFCYSQIIW